MVFPFSSTCIVLCGKTGSGKSLVLHQLELSGYPIINLEKIASHRGSAFGELSLPSQPSQPEFEKELQNECSRYAASQYIFIEQKPGSLGKRKIPGWLYSKMKEGILVHLDAEKKIRIQNILTEYKPAGKDNLINALHKLNGRLPASQLTGLERFLHRDNYEMFIEKMLDYYDTTINYQSPGKAVVTLKIKSNDVAETTQQLLYSLLKNGINIPVYPLLPLGI
jgi:tRNA 2-selenouridine synthase